jgi:hypothetical protein
MTALLSYDAKLATARICWSFARGLSHTLMIEFISDYCHAEEYVLNLMFVSSIQIRTS